VNFYYGNSNSKLPPLRGVARSESGLMRASNHRKTIIMKGILMLILTVGVSLAQQGNYWSYDPLAGVRPDHTGPERVRAHPPRTPGDPPADWAASDHQRLPWLSADVAVSRAQPAPHRLLPRIWRPALALLSRTLVPQWLGFRNSTGAGRPPIVCHHLWNTSPSSH